MPGEATDADTVAVRIAYDSTYTFQSFPHGD
jgi:hypothetical protein